MAFCLGCGGPAALGVGGGGSNGVDGDGGGSEDHGNSPGLDDTLKQIERRLICEALKESSGIQVRAAEKLGINQRSLWNRVKKYGIDVGVYK